MPSLLAIDLGVRTGLALYGQDGRLIWYRSRNFGSAARLRLAVPQILDDIHDLAYLIVEGGGPLAVIWARQAERRNISVRQIGAEAWRNDLLYPRLRRTGQQAKQSADTLARRVIDWSGIQRPTSLRHDAAEAVLIGLWGSLQVGLLASLPDELHP